jgi:dihydroxyacetone kinase-like protein
MEVAADALNTLDGQLGDGDLGVTMVRGGREVNKALPTLPADVGMALMACAQAFTRASGSSYGTLLATALLSAAKATKGRTEVPWTEVPALLDGAVAAMMARGKASLGDKTVLDTLNAAIRAIEGMDDPAKMLAAATAAVDATLERMRGEPAKIGRARIFADRSIGLDDPGQMAFREILRGLATPA